MIGDRWGVSESEIVRSYPCDDFVTSPALQAWRGVGVEAPAEAVWPWVTQVRVAPYSYDWIDNLGRRSPRKLMGLPEPHIEERFTTAGGREWGQIVSVDPGKQLTGRIMGAFMSYPHAPGPRHDTSATQDRHADQSLGGPRALYRRSDHGSTAAAELQATRREPPTPGHGPSVIAAPGGDRPVFTVQMCGTRPP